MNVKEFKYLTLAQGRQKSETVQEYYEKDDLETRFIIRDESKNTYKVFINEKTFIKYDLSLRSEDKHFHEVIFGWKSQKLKFDLDVTDEKLNNIDDDILMECGAITNPPESNSDKIKKIMAFVIKKLNALIFNQYFSSNGVQPALSDVIVTTSTGEENSKMKYSYHIITRSYAVQNNEEAKIFLKKLFDVIPMDLYPLFDQQVNKSTQNFRLLNSTKVGSNRVKKICTDFGTFDGTFEDTLITCTGKCEVLSKILITNSEPIGSDILQKDLTGDVLSDVLRLTKEYTEGHEYRDIRGNLISYNRLRPTLCNVCKKMHEKDNTLMFLIITNNEGKGTKILEYCRHKPGCSITVYEPISEGVKKICMARYHVDKINSGKINPHDSLKILFETLPNSQKNVYSEDKMRDYEHVPTFVGKSQMGLGKTIKLLEYLQQYFPDNEIEKPIIRYITFRKTFSRVIKEKFTDFTLYSDIRGDIKHEDVHRLIIQVESLHRIVLSPFPDPIDLLILDEIESIIFQFNSGLHKSFNESWSLFQWMLKTAKYVVLLDANLTDRTFKLLKKLRPDHEIFFHWNKYEKAKDDTYIFTTYHSSWLEKMRNDVINGKKIVIPSNSKTEARFVDEFLKRNCSNIRTKMYSGETKQSEKDLHFSDVKKYWMKYDVLIYTPTVSAGISFEEVYFDKLYGFFTDTSCEIETCRQMLGRVRNLNDKEYNLCLSGVKKTLPVNSENIKKMIFHRRKTLFKEIGTGTVSFDYNQDGTLNFYKTSYFDVWVETLKLVHLSKNDFIMRFINQVADTGAKLSYMGLCDEAEEMADSRKEIKKEIRDEDLKNVADAACITLEDFCELQEKMAVGDIVTKDEKFSYDKFALQECYSLFGKEINAEWVGKYDSSISRSIYKNLKKILKHRTIDESLFYIQKKEREHFVYAIGTGSCEAESKDLQFNYTYHKHMYAIAVLKKMGFKCITDTRMIAQEFLEKQVNVFMGKDLEKILEVFNMDFNINISSKKVKFQHFLDFLRIINKITRAMYGIEIKKYDHELNTYYIDRSQMEKLFNVRKDGIEYEDDENDYRPIIISNLTYTNCESDDMLNEYDSFEECDD
jgi:hypothetical protein